MEPVIQTEKDARRLSSAKRSVAHEQQAPASSKEHQDTLQPNQESTQSPDVELSTFVTAAEYAREGKELQSFSSARHESEVRSLDKAFFIYHCVSAFDALHFHK